jgi:hypothetical protein
VSICAIYMVYVMYVFLNVENVDVATTTTRSEPNHSFLFIGGPHFSGTTLLAMMFGESESISTFEVTTPTYNNHKMKGSLIVQEGQHLQDVFPTARKFGGPCRYGAAKKGVRFTEFDHLPREETLYDQWALKWDLKRPILLEKSPPHIMHSRWLQAVFRERTSSSGSISFVFTMKHPLSIYEKHCKGRVSEDTYLENWISQLETLREDITSLERAYVIRYEDWLSSKSTAIRTFEKLQTEIEDQHARYNHWRRLQFFHGKVGSIRPYVATWKPLSPSDVLVHKYESRLLPFGYSLTTHDMVLSVLDPKYAFRDYIVDAAATAV